MSHGLNEERRLWGLGNPTPQKRKSQCCSSKCLAACVIGCCPSSFGRTRGRLQPPGGALDSFGAHLGQPEETCADDSGDESDGGRHTQQGPGP